MATFWRMPRDSSPGSAALRGFPLVPSARARRPISTTPHAWRSPECSSTVSIEQVRSSADASRRCFERIGDEVVAIDTDMARWGRCPPATGGRRLPAPLGPMRPRFLPRDSNDRSSTAVKSSEACLVLDGNGPRRLC